MKKIFYGLGATTLAITPAIAVVSCGCGSKINDAQAAAQTKAENFVKTAFPDLAITATVTEFSSDNAVFQVAEAKIRELTAKMDAVTKADDVKGISRWHKEVTFVDGDTFAGSPMSAGQKLNPWIKSEMTDVVSNKSTTGKITLSFIVDGKNVDVVVIVKAHNATGQQQRDAAVTASITNGTLVLSCTSAIGSGAKLNGAKILDAMNTVGDSATDIALVIDNGTPVEIMLEDLSLGLTSTMGYATKAQIAAALVNVIKDTTKNYASLRSLFD